MDVNRRVRGETPLFLACACNSRDLSTVEVLLKAGADPSIFCPGDWQESQAHLIGSGNDGSPQDHQQLQMNCLHKLCSRRMDEAHIQPVLSLFIEAGIDLNQRNSDGETILHLAARGQWPLMTLVLLDAGLDANIYDSNGNTLLRLASDPTIMSLLIENGRANIEAVNEQGETPLLRALSTAHTQDILKLLEYRPDCNAVDRQRNSSVHRVLQNRPPNPKILRVLLDGGADPNRKNHDGLSPLLFGIRFFRARNRNYATQLREVLLDGGADINSVDSHGSTMLFREQPSLFELPSLTSPQVDTKIVITEMIGRGASVHIRDFRGRTLLHEAMRLSSSSGGDGLHTSVTIPSLSFLLGLGLDPKAVDHNSNSLLHELALQVAANSLRSDGWYGEGAAVLWQWLLDRGLDLDEKNHAGRTPLHLFCMTTSNRHPVIPGMTSFSFVVSKMADLNSSDIYGVCSLHVAVTANEQYVMSLLDAGADPTLATREGLTPLHLAARCRQSNMVGMLLDALQRRSGKSSNMLASRGPSFQPSHDGPTMPEPIPGVNAKAYGEHSHLTPLFYACQSGRPETVALLLAAGADVRGSLQGCLGFETEDRLWSNPDQLRRVPGYEFRGDAVGLRIDDTARPKVGTGDHADHQYHRTPNATSRIEEILEMLVRHGADLSPYQDSLGTLPDKIKEGAVYKSSDSRDLSRSELKKLTIAEFVEHEGSTSKPASIQALKEFKGVKPGQSNQSLFYHFLVRRDYHLIEELALIEGAFLTRPAGEYYSNFRFLVYNGLTRLVETIGAAEAERSLENGGYWHAFGQPTRPGLWCAQREAPDPNTSSYEPAFFLRDAVSRDVPNLEMVKLLVERFGVDVNEVQPTTRFKDIVDTPSDSALHFVAQGRAWWHAHQALPFLLRSGAKADIRDGHGRTPLHLALRSQMAFSRDTLRILLGAGADPNAVDADGKSCFDYAWRHGNKLRLLLDHGAEVVLDAIEAAIRAEDAAILEVMLAGRGELASGGISTGVNPIGDQNPLLLQACRNLSGSPGKPPKIEAGIEVVRVLMHHGADPLTKFWQKLNRKDKYKRVETWDVTGTGTQIVKTTHQQWLVIHVDRLHKNTTVTPGGDEYRVATVLHELLLGSYYVDCLLDAPGIDLNHRDAEGRTAIHAACQAVYGPDYANVRSASGSASETPTSVFQRLTSLGADLEARDDSSRNVLHHMFDSGDEKGKDFSRFRNALREVLRVAPALINQADGGGRTPLREAVVHAAKRRDAEMADLFPPARREPARRGRRRRQPPPRPHAQARLGGHPLPLPASRHRLPEWRRRQRA